MSPPANRSRNQRKSKSAQFKAAAPKSGQLRIIAGQWRGRKLPIADVTGLRPTGDRLRETLFNWLQTAVGGAHCLDLFAGTGALGFEALSRHARSATLVEPNASAFRALQVSAQTLGIEDSASLRLSLCTAQAFLSNNEQAFDVVFVDPPFSEALQWPILSQLAAGHLQNDALVYVEAPASQSAPPQWPAGLNLIKDRKLGDVQARLFNFTAL